MRIIRVENYEELSKRAGALLAAQITLKPNSVLGLATGTTPIGAYEHLIQGYESGDLDFRAVQSVNLDEYEGLSGSDPQSYRYFMNDKLFDHVNIDKERTFVPSGRAEAGAECVRYDELIESLGGVDLQLLGLGRNGHIGFNEPSDVFPAGTHTVALTESTIQANSRLFAKAEDVPRHAITMGIRTIMRAKKILLIASGADKAEALKSALYGPITPQLPASILQLHSDLTVVADAAALPEAA